MVGQETQGIFDILNVIKILGWCPVGPVLPHDGDGEGVSLALVDHPSKYMVHNKNALRGS